MRKSLMIPAGLIVGIILTAVAGAGGAAPMSAPIVVFGFDTPESVVHDRVNDVYLVSSINGSPTGRDDNGYISRVAPSGQILAPRWIDGASDLVLLHAPKGMAIAGNTLYVTDITAVRMFDLRTGGSRGAIGIPGATFLNDAAAGPDGSIYVTDSGLRPDFSPSGTDAVYRIQGMRVTTVARGRFLGNPNGVVVLPNGRLAIVPFSPPGRIIELSTGGEPRQTRNLPFAQLDGVVVERPGSLLVSSWGASAVYRVRGGQSEAVVRDVPSPADIGYDSRRRTLLIPLFMGNRLIIQPLR